ncbi:MAG: T9SS type A sorting domain-containing protein, partial [Bacteroidota bacterium]
RSTDKKNWENKNAVAATGNSSVPVSYTTTDEVSTIKGNLYYRLIQYDLNGDMYTSKVVQLDLDDDLKTTIHVYPNPATTQLNVEGLQSEGKLYNSTGAEIQVVSNGCLNVDHLPAGMYYIRSANQTIKFIKE